LQAFLVFPLEKKHMIAAPTAIHPVIIEKFILYHFLFGNRNIYIYISQ
jgi:hypothetical protein